MLDSLRRDLRDGFRAVVAAPAVSATIVCLVALVVDGNTTVYGIVHAVLTKPARGVVARELVTIQRFDSREATRTVGGAALLATAEASRQAQPQPTAPSSPAFEVATIKPNTSGSRARSLGYPPNRFVATNTPLRWLIGNAYGDALPFRQDMIFGGPSWVVSEGYDVEAKASSAGTSAPDVATRKLMLRKLLVDRFALKLRTETRELPLYALVVAREDGRLGRRLASSAGEDCVNRPSPNGAASTLPPCGPGGPRPWGEAGGYFVTIDEIGKTLGQFLDRPVLDKTGLSGRFTFALTFAPTSTVTPAPGAPPDPPPDPDAASIFTAVREQLGLKLESQRGPVDVLVIDAAERPIPD